MELLIIQQLAYFALIQANIIHDAILINYYKRSPKHSKNVYIVGALATLSGIVCLWLSKDPVHIIPMLLYMPERWFLHDPLLNLLTGKNAKHIGKKADKEEDAKLDDFLEIDPPKQFVFKGMLMVVMITACIIFYSLFKYYFL